MSITITNLKVDAGPMNYEHYIKFDVQSDGKGIQEVEVKLRGGIIYKKNFQFNIHSYHFVVSTKNFSSHFSNEVMVTAKSHNKLCFINANTLRTVQAQGVNIERLQSLVDQYFSNVSELIKILKEQLSYKENEINIIVTYRCEISEMTTAVSIVDDPTVIPLAKPSAFINTSTVNEVDSLESLKLAIDNNLPQIILNNPELIIEVGKCLENTKILSDKPKRFIEPITIGILTLGTAVLYAISKRYDVELKIDKGCIIFNLKSK